MTQIKQIYADDSNYESDLIEFAKENNSWIPFVSGFILAIVAATSFIVIYKHYDCYDCNVLIYITCIIAVLLIVAAIICFLIYKKMLTQRTMFQQERIFLRDLSIAMHLTEQIVPEIDIQTIKKDTLNENESTIRHLAIRSRQKEKIIQTLLNRYPN